MSTANLKIIYKMNFLSFSVRFFKHLRRYVNNKKINVVKKKKPPDLRMTGDCVWKPLEIIKPSPRADLVFPIHSCVTNARDRLGHRSFQSGFFATREMISKSSRLNSHYDSREENGATTGVLIGLQNSQVYSYRP